MELPFSREEFFDLFAAYNRALWPAAIVLWVASAWACRLLTRPCTAGRARQLAAVLAAHWIWSALAYHAAFFTRINPAAWLFAVLFFLQGALFVRAAMSGSSLCWPLARPRWAAAGWGLVGYAMLYPALNAAQHQTLLRVPTFGVPCPTTIFTMGVLLLAARRWSLAVIPLVWSVIGGSAAVLLGVWADYMLPIGGMILTLHCTRRPPPRTS